MTEVRYTFARIFYMSDTGERLSSIISYESLQNLRNGALPLAPICRMRKLRPYTW